VSAKVIVTAIVIAVETEATTISNSGIEAGTAVVIVTITVTPVS